MRVLCITENLGSGGAERQLTGLAVLLKQEGYDVTFITYVRKQFYEEYLHKNGICYELLEGAKNKYTRAFHLAKVFKKYTPDVVISYLSSTSMSVCLTKLLFGFKFKLIVSERSHTDDVSLRIQIKFLLYRQADYIVTNSFSEADFTRKAFPWTDYRLRTITNFVDTERFKPTENKTANTPFLILSVGRIIPCKNIINYIRAIKTVKDQGYSIEVKWVGDNYDKAYYEKCSDEIKRLELQQVFKFVPPITTIEEYYQQADAFCLPSLFEGFPNVICEAMACGLPILCSDICDNPQIVKDTQNGLLFNPQSEQNMAETIITLLNTSVEKRTQMSRFSRSLALSKFSVDTFVKKYKALIED